MSFNVVYFLAHWFCSGCCTMLFTLKCGTRTSPMQFHYYWQSFIISPMNHWAARITITTSHHRTCNLTNEVDQCACLAGISGCFKERHRLVSQPPKHSKWNSSACKTENYISDWEVSNKLIPKCKNISSVWWSPLKFQDVKSFCKVYLLTISYRKRLRNRNK